MMVIFIVALLGMPITAFILGQVWLGAVFMIFYGIFGVIEVVAKVKTGKTVSQHVDELSKGKKIVLVSSMATGWIALILHFLGVIK